MTTLTLYSLSIPIYSQYNRINIKKVELTTRGNCN
jgi:hypothetical protein